MCERPDDRISARAHPAYAAHRVFWLERRRISGDECRAVRGDAARSEEVRYDRRRRLLRLHRAATARPTRRAANPPSPMAVLRVLVRAERGVRGGARAASAVEDFLRPGHAGRGGAEDPADLAARRLPRGRAPT